MFVSPFNINDYETLIQDLLSSAFTHDSECTEPATACVISLGNSIVLTSGIIKGETHLFWTDEVP